MKEDYPLSNTLVATIFFMAGILLLFHDGSKATACFIASAVVTWWGLIE